MHTSLLLCSQSALLASPLLRFPLLQKCFGDQNVVLRRDSAAFMISDVQKEHMISKV